MASSVRIVVPMYNSQYWITDLLDSIVAQTFTNWECVLVDDASIDDTLNIVKFYLQDLKNNDGEDLSKKFIIKTHKENQQVSITRNDGMLDEINGVKKYPSTTYTYFCDADDTLEPTLLERAVTAADNYNVPLLQFGHSCIRGRSKDQWFRNLIPAEGIYDQILTKWYCSVWNFLFKTSYLEKYNILFDKDISQGEDELFLLQYSWYMFKDNEKYGAIPDILYCYRYLNPTSLIVVCTPQDKQAYKRKLLKFTENKKDYGGTLRRMKSIANSLDKNGALIQYKDTLPLGLQHT